MIEEAMESAKRFTKNDFTCIVSVYLDKEYLYENFDDVAKNKRHKIVHHEFDDMVLADEYCKTLQELNNEFLGKFFYKVQYIPTESSKKYTNIISLQTYSTSL
jgi:hypothetical protein